MKITLLMMGLLSSCANMNILPVKENVVFSKLNHLEGNQDILTFVMEVPKGSTNKYELRAATGNLFLDRHICPREVYGTKAVIQKYPITYGIAPGYFNVDGDPLDVVVIGSDSKYQDLIKHPEVSKPQQVRIVGLYKMEECEELVCANGKGWIQDWKIIAVDLDDKNVKNIKDIKDVSSDLKYEITDYWSNYKGGRVIAGYGYSSKTRVAGFLNKKETLDFVKKNFTAVDPKMREKEIADCHDVYANRAKAKQVNQNMDTVFLKCLEQVHYDGFKPKHKDFEFLSHYAGYQYLLKLGETGVTMDNVMEKMAKRKNEGKTYYRYVSYDIPSPATQFLNGLKLLIKR